jgi:prepilin-type processing-associated H-X9-DG protein
MAEALSELAERGYHVVPGGDGATFVIGPSGVFAVEEGLKATSKQLEHVRTSALRAGQAFADGHVSVMPVFMAQGAKRANTSHGVMIVPPEELVPVFDAAPAVLTDQQCYGLAARATVMLGKRPEATKPPLEKVKPPSRAFGVMLVLGFLLALAWGIAMLAANVLGQPTA